MFEDGYFLVCQKLFSSKPVRSFQRCQNVTAAPDALQIRVAPRRPRACHRTGRGRRIGIRGSCGLLVRAWRLRQPHAGNHGSEPTD